MSAPELLPEPDWARLREDFPALSGCTYLNTATFGQTSRQTVDAVMRHFDRRNAMACSDFLTWFDDADAIRELAARLISARASDIAFINTAATALAWLMNGIAWNAGDRILTLESEFPNNLYFPATLAYRGVEVIETPWDQIDAHLDERVRLVLVSTVNYMSGFRPELEPLSRKLRDLGALLYVDGTQSVGALRFDVRSVQPDMLAVHGYKWLLSPNGAGFAYVSERLREIMRPTVIGWRSDSRWREVDQLHHGIPQFSEGAERYEGGMLNFPSLYGMGASLQQLLGAGPAAIERRVLALSSRCADILEEAGGEVAHRNSPIVAARFAGDDAPALATALTQKGVLVSARHGRLRVSTHFYNNDEDLSMLGNMLGMLSEALATAPGGQPPIRGARRE